MPDFAELPRQGEAQVWLYLPSAILLGALRGWSIVGSSLLVTITGRAIGDVGHRSRMDVGDPDLLGRGCVRHLSAGSRGYV